MTAARRVRSVWAGAATARLSMLLAVAALAGLVTAGTASAQDDDVRVLPVIASVDPALPADSLVTVAPDGALAAAVSGDVPLAVLDPDGREFLRISAHGVEADAAVPFTYLTRARPGSSARVPEGAAPDAPARWVRVSEDASWRWFDPRTRPAGVVPPAGGDSGAPEVLATWTVPVRHGDTPATVGGRLELHRAGGWFRTGADPAPAGLDVVVTPGDAPSIVLRRTTGDPVTVLGAAGEPFLRTAADGGWEADLASPTYREMLLAAGRPVPAGSGWIRYAEPGPAAWSDPRLVPPPTPGAAVDATGPAEVARWAIPVRVGTADRQVTGAVTFLPRPGAERRSIPGGAIGLGAVVVLLGAAAVALAARQRRLTRASRDLPRATSDPSRTTPDPSRAGRDSARATRHEPDPDHSPRPEGAPLP